METNLIPSMKETLFGSVKNDIESPIAEYLEVGLDSILEEGVLKEIPVIRTIVALCKTGINLRERNLLKQTAAFIQSFNAGSIDPDKVKEYRKKLDGAPQKANKEIGRVILLLDRNIEVQKSRIVALLFRAYVEEKLDWAQFIELTEVNSRMVVSDYTELDFMAGHHWPKTGEIPDSEFYRVKRLSSLGLVMEQPLQLSGRPLDPLFQKEYSYYSLSPLGQTLYDLLPDMQKL